MGEGSMSGWQHLAPASSKEQREDKMDSHQIKRSFSSLSIPSQPTWGQAEDSDRLRRANIRECVGQFKAFMLNTCQNMAGMLRCWWPSSG